jgi:hypothetical protein
MISVMAILTLTEYKIQKIAIELLEKQGYQYIYAFASKLYGGKRS